MNIRRLVFIAFLVPIIAVAFVSISHVTTWYGIANPVKWAMYLSVGVEIAALSALAGFSINLGRFLYPPLILVTIIQFIGNVFYNFQFIDVNGELFKDWVELTSPLFYMMGVEPTDISAHKRLLSVLEGGFLPAISLFFMHLLMKIDEMKDKKVEEKEISESPKVYEEPKESAPFDAHNHSEWSLSEEEDIKVAELVEEIPEQKDEEYIMTQKDLEEIFAQNDAELLEKSEHVDEIKVEDVEEVQEQIEQPQEVVKEVKAKRLHYTK